MAGSIKGIIVEIGGDTSGLQKALSKVNSATSSLSKELRGINSLLKLDPSNTTLLSQKQKVLAENIETTGKKLEELKKAQELADETILQGGEVSQENYRSLQREIEATQIKLNSLKAEASKWNTAGNAMVDFGDKVTAISNKIDKLGTTLTTGLTLPIVALTGALINSSKEFETAFTGVEKTVDGTAEQMEELKQGIKDMAEEIPSSTTEIAGVAEAAGQLGIQTENILSFSKAMIDLGNSTNLTADEAASQLAKFANIMQMSQKDFDKLGSSIVDLGNNFATTEADIVEMAMRIAGAGKQVGLSEGQVLGLATALSSVGIEAEMGGSAISKAMVKMQNAVELGGGKLNTVLKKTGMSLRDLELMSANDSKGFKEMSQSIGMTSTEVKQLITAGTNLEDFAKVSGMSAKEFQQAWEQDASGALTAFIKGLGNAEDKGESAISMLSEMGLTEVRLRDSLLRAANAGDLFNNAIETGTKAWDENTALANEANKRYQTLDSRLKMTTNKIKNLVTNTGDKLTPTFNKLLDKVDGLIDKFDGLTEEEINNIIKTTALVAATGPAIKVIGTLGTTVGTGITTFGNFAKAVANVKSGVKTAEGQVGTFTTILSKLLSPAGLATTAIVTLTAATAIYAKKQADEVFGLNGITESIDKQQQSWQNLQKARNEQLESSSLEISNLQNLKDELSQITDENGKVKEGYKDRANVILNELNSALGTEISLNGDVIDSYQEVQAEIQRLIEQKKAEALLSAYADEYAEAMKKQAEATESLVNLKKQLAEEESNLINLSGRDRAEAEMRISAISQQIKEESQQISQYGYTIQNYEKLQEASVSGSAEAIKQATEQMGISWDTAKTQASQSLQEQITSQQEYVNALKSSLQDAKISNDEYQAYIIQKQLDSANERLTNLQKELNTTSTTIDTNTAIQTAMANLGKRSTKLYDGEISQLKPLTDMELYNVSQGIDSDTSIQNSTGMMAQRATSEFANNDKISLKMQEEVNATANVENSDTKIGSGAARLANEANTKFNNNVNGNKWGADLTDNISSGILSRKSNVSSAASTIAGIIKSFLGHSLPDKGPLTDEMSYMPDMIDNLVKTLYSSSPKLERASFDVAEKMATNLDLSKYQSGVSSQVIDSTKTVFTTPQIVFNVQELDEAKLQQCFNYVNRKFGSSY